MPTYQFTYDEYSSEHDLDPGMKALLFHAREAVDNAYAPYSKFFVGAAVLLENGHIVKGMNIENASYPVGICAERSALSSALSSFPKLKIKAIAISYFTPTGLNNAPAFPCGMCRQFMAECEDRNQAAIPILLAARTGKVLLIHSVKDILPFSFSGKDLS